MILRDFFRKFKWFVQHFSQISYSKHLIDTTEIGVPKNIFLGPLTYTTDSLVTSNNCDFIKDPRFAKAYAAAFSTKPWDGFTLQWRTYIVCWFADMVKKLDGDFVECGVNTGAYSRAVIDYIDFPSTNKTFYLLDTFDGLDASLVSEEEKKAGIDVYFGEYKNMYERALKTFTGFNTRIIKGTVPDTLPQCDAKTICYLSIDMNCVEPEIKAAEYFWDKIVKGGVIVLDDYGFPMHIHQKLAFDDFAKRKNQSILSLPTGQGVIIKSN
ncbi:MAG: methyltransferase [Bacteroidetes bacterium]|nr:MAG: methyltransferase [Bacteroidota bacterium]